MNAEQASHDEGFVKGSHHGASKSPVASLSKVQAHLRDAARFRARSTSHAVAAHAAAPRSRFRRAGLRKTRTILESGVSGHGLLRFVYLDPPGLIRSWEMTELVVVEGVWVKPVVNLPIQSRP